MKALRLRASYGGMQGDQAMMRRYADLWQARWPSPVFHLADFNNEQHCA